MDWHLWGNFADLVERENGVLKWKTSRFLRKWGITYCRFIEGLFICYEILIFQRQFSRGFLSLSHKTADQQTLLSVLLYFRFSRSVSPVVYTVCRYILLHVALVNSHTEHLTSVLLPLKFYFISWTFVQIQRWFWIIALIDLITGLEAAISTTRQRLVRNDSVCRRISIADHLIS